MISPKWEDVTTFQIVLSYFSRVCTRFFVYVIETLMQQQKRKIKEVMKVVQKAGKIATITK